jgi:hypothetical protein
VAARQLEEQVLQAHPRRFGLLPELVHGPAGGDPSLLHDRDPVAHDLRDLECVGAHEHRSTPIHELAEQVLQQSRALGIEPHHGLIHHDQLRAVHQGAADDQLLPHAVAVRFGELVLPGAEIEDLQQLVDAPLHLRPVLAVQRRREAEELAAGELVVDERAVGDEADPRLGLQRPGQHVLAADQDRAAGRL